MNPYPSNPSGIPSGISEGDASQHHCLIYGDRYEFESAVRRFVVDGIRLERRVLLIGGAVSLEPTEIMAKVALSGDLYPSRADQVLFHSAHDVYHKNGSFDRYRAITFIRNQIRLARSDGFRGLHLVQDVGSLATTDGELRDIVAFEAGIGTLLSDVPRSVLCLFNRQSTSPELLVACLDTHPTHLVDDRLRAVGNPFYRTEIALGAPRYDEVARERLEILERLRRTEEAAGLPPLTALLHRVTRWTDERGISVDGLMKSALKEVGDFIGSSCGRVYIVHPSRDSLIPSSPWIGTRGVDDSGEDIGPDSPPLSRGEGAAGTAWLTRKPVWLVDPNQFEEAGPEIRDFDAKGQIAIPMISGGDVVAVLDFLISDDREVNESALADLEAIARVVGEALARLQIRDEIEIERTRLGTLLGDNGDAIVVTDRSGRVRSWNRRAARALELEGIEVPVGRSIGDFLPSQLQGRVLDGIRILGSDGAPGFGGNMEFQLPQGEGKGELTGITLASTSAESNGSVLVLLRTAAGEQRSSGFAGVTPRTAEPGRDSASYLTLSPDLRWGGPVVVSAEHEFCAMTGLSESELLGRTLRSLSDPRADRLAVDSIDEGFATLSPFEVDLNLTRKGGDPLLLPVAVVPVYQGDGTLGHFVVRERDRLHDEAVSEVLKRADTDPLTGLANRFLFDKMLGRAIERSQKNSNLHFGVLFLDLDRFKHINDSRGHVTGDQLLVAVARELEQAVRPGDVIARFGGDEFVVLVDLVGGLREVVAVAERISERLAAPIPLEEEHFSLSVSIGIAVSDTGYTTIEEVLRDADIAMYQAKQKGGGGYRIFDAKLREGIASANLVRNALQESLARGEFRLHYQPLVDLHSNRITGLEALLRWEHPERGIVSAAEFIALAEDSGLILPIGRWVIREACRQLASWKDQLGSEIDLTLSVNLSSRELISPELPTWIRRSLEETGADPGSLRIEIPESFIADATKDIDERFRELRDLGIQISIGDFGGGELSLRQLLRFPVDTLKIDCRLFFSPSHLPEESGEAQMNERVLRSILAVAASLDVEVVASAVETRLQWETLRKLSFRVGQGYLFSRPVEATGAQSLFQKIWSDRSTKEAHPA